MQATATRYRSIETLLGMCLETKKYPVESWDCRDLKFEEVPSGYVKIAIENDH